MIDAHAAETPTIIACLHDRCLDLAACGMTIPDFWTIRDLFLTGGTLYRSARG
jgi:hypothetical protein